MYFKVVVCLINVLILDVQGLKLFSFYNNHRRLEKLRSAAKLTSARIVTCWITQKLDHFDANETRTWKMRYFKTLDYWKRNGPIYLFIGGESTMYPYELKTGLHEELAKETKGALFMSEHRYYGKSQPVKKRNIQGMKFLTTPQALGDIAELIRKIKSTVPFKHSKVVVVGGSYPGNLAAWLKLVYPNLVNAAIASSAPVLAKRDFFEFLEVINNNYEKYGTADCVKNIRSKFQRYYSLFQTKTGIRQLKEEENICEVVDLTDPKNKNTFILTKLNVFGEVSMNGYVENINNHCEKINKPYSLYNETNEDDLYWYENGTCNLYDFKKLVQTLREDKDAHSWNYQICTEYGFFFTTTSDNQPFSKNLDVEFWDSICTALFGTSFDKYRVIEGINKINHMYGGRSPNVTEVVFVNGELDPWSALGILKDLSPKAPAIYIPKACHCSDLMPGRDFPEVEEAKTRIKLLIKQWIGYHKKTSFEFDLSISVVP